MFYNAFADVILNTILDVPVNVFNSISTSTRNTFKIGLNDYLVKQRERTEKIKTLLHGTEPINLLDIYFPLRLRFKILAEGKRIEKSIKTENIENVFQKSNFITVVGDAGSGKTTLVKYLFIQSIRQNYAIPIMIILRELNENKYDLKTYIIQQVFRNKISENDSILEKALENGKIVFFLDGFDELNTTIKNDVTKEIEKFVNEYPSNKYILTTRPYTGIEILPMFKNHEVCGLDFDKGEVEEFIKKQLFKEMELASKIIESLSKNLQDHHHIRTFLSNPLLLLLYLIKFQTNAGVSSKKSQFYRDVIEALFYRHDSISKYWSGRERVCGLNQEQFEYILTRFSYISFFEAKYGDWNIDYINHKLDIIKKNNEKLVFENRAFIIDMQIGVGLWVEDANLYSFTHRSLQEYFAALSITQVKSDTKNIVYERIKQNTEYMSYEEKYHLLSLLEEMDALAFYKYYALPYLEDIDNILKNENPENITVDNEKKVVYFNKGTIRLFCNKYSYFTHELTLYFITNQVLNTEDIVNQKIIKSALFLRPRPETSTLNYFESFNKAFEFSEIEFQDIIYNPLRIKSFATLTSYHKDTTEYKLAKIQIQNQIHIIECHIKQVEESDVLFLDLI